MHNFSFSVVCLYQRRLHFNILKWCEKQVDLTVILSSSGDVFSKNEGKPRVGTRLLSFKYLLDQRTVLSEKETTVLETVGEIINVKGITCFAEWKLNAMRDLGGGMFYLVYSRLPGTENY